MFFIRHEGQGGGDLVPRGCLGAWQLHESSIVTRNDEV